MKTVLSRDNFEVVYFNIIASVPGLDSALTAVASTWTTSYNRSRPRFNEVVVI